MSVKSPVDPAVTVVNATNAQLLADDYTITLVPRMRLTGALVARYDGVKLYAYEEVANDDH